MKHPASCNFSQTCVHLNLKHDFKFWAVFMLSQLFRQAQVSSPKTRRKGLWMAQSSGPHQNQNSASPTQSRLILTKKV